MGRNVSIGIGAFFLMGFAGGVLTIFSGGFVATDLITLLISGGLGYWFFVVKGIKIPKTERAKRAKPVIKQETDKPQEEKIQTKAAIKNDNRKRFEVWVAGMKHENEKGIKIQKVIKEYIKNEIESGMEEPYEGMTNKEIIESGEERVYETTIESFALDDIKFVPEPENPYDSNAIQIFHEELGRIGYVPKELTAKVYEIIQGEYETDYKILGGKYKEVYEGEEGNEKVQIVNSDYNIQITILH